MQSSAAFTTSTSQMRGVARPLNNTKSSAYAQPSMQMNQRSSASMTMKANGQFAKSQMSMAAMRTNGASMKMSTAGDFSSKNTWGTQKIQGAPVAKQQAGNQFFFDQIETSMRMMTSGSGFSKNTGRTLANQDVSFKVTNFGSA